MFPSFSSIALNACQKTCSYFLCKLLSLLNTGEGHFKNLLITLLVHKGTYMSEELLGAKSTSKLSLKEAEEGGGDGIP